MKTFAKFFDDLFRQVTKDPKALFEKFKQWIDELIQAIKKELGLVDEVAEGAGYVRRGKYLGQALEEADFIIIENFLKKLKVEFQIGKGKGAFEVVGYFYKSGKPLLLEAHQAAMFVTDGIKMRLVLRENATVYEVLHELMHLRDCQKIGMKKFIEKSLVEKEKYVYDKMVEYAKYLNRKELEHSEWYINWHYDKIGKTDNLGNKIKEILPIKLESIPQKRQEINIDKILKLI